MSIVVTGMRLNPTIVAIKLTLAMIEHVRPIVKPITSYAGTNMDFVKK